MPEMSETTAIQTLRLADLNVRECVKMQTDPRPFAVIGNRSRIPLFIGIPCSVSAEDQPLAAIREVVEQLAKHLVTEASEDT